MKAIRFNVETQEVEQIELENTLDGIYNAIGNQCSTFEVAKQFELSKGTIAILCDEEGRINGRPNGAIFLSDLISFQQLVCGNAILLGCDDENDFIDCPLDLELAQCMPHVFYSKEESEKYQLV
jgi:hypothetical protein